jgi:ferredoxin
MVVVVGSGPAGVSAARALLKQGVPVTLLDVGLELEPERLIPLQVLASRDKAEWKPSDMAELRGEVKASLKGIPLKRIYGSDHPHRDVGQLGKLDLQIGNPVSSPARGGFSNVWGAQFMPNIPSDITDWCVSLDELEPHYRAILEFVPLTGRRDALAEVVPFYTDRYRLLRPNQQAEKFLAALSKNEGVLRQEGFRFGLARLAVQPEAESENGRSCAYCGLCMHGCPYHLIYSSGQTLDDLCGQPGFTYRSGVIVDRVVEDSDGVVIQGRSVGDHKPVMVEADRVYLACGSVATTRILMNSLDIIGQDVIIRDSVRLLMPMLFSDFTPDVMQEAMHTLGQVNVLLQDPEISDYSIHLQYYMYNDHFLATMQGVAGPLYSAIRPLLPQLLGRIGVAFGWLHSSDSPHMVVRLENDGDGQKTFRIRSVANPHTQKVLDQITTKLMRNRRYFRAMPIKAALKIMEAGNGYHYGASFPMMNDPKGCQTDRWGRPPGKKRIHAVDGAVLPAITSTTFTFTIMANAHRIASAVREMD